MTHLFFLIQFICSLLFALCSLLFAFCFLLFAFCFLLFAFCVSSSCRQRTSTHLTLDLVLHIDLYAGHRALFRRPVFRFNRQGFPRIHKLSARMVNTPKNNNGRAVRSFLCQTGQSQSMTTDPFGAVNANDKPNSPLLTSAR